MFDFSSSNRSHSPSTHVEACPDQRPPAWFALCIGNTRSHWAYIEAGSIRATWEAPHLTTHDFDNDILPDLQYRSQSTSLHIPIVIASVVPHQTDLWQTGLDRSAYPYRILHLADIPLTGLYPTLGIDRALAGLGVGQRLGFPCLTIDGGTALTFTGFSSVECSRSSLTLPEDGSQEATLHHPPDDSPDDSPDNSLDNSPDHPSNDSLKPPAMGILIGGAILPGMGLQYRSLGQQTAQLSAVRSAFEGRGVRRPFPARRWARETLGAIDSGIHRAIGAIAWDFITDWRRRYPAAIVAITGGDAIAIETAIHQHVHERDGRPLSQDEHTRMIVIPEAIVWGMMATLDAIVSRPDRPDHPDTSGDCW
ncbi:MAG: type III pantothenate kinase [Coleofasciculaceae cyanobacterium RL_1_1]|nr:type III pantothenate kinase [Coleofasciculaceae cyanobacterium RL_1_1]